MTLYDDPPPMYTLEAPRPATFSNPPHTDQTAAHRILHVYHEGLTHRQSHILDSDKLTELYTIKSNWGGWFASKPDVKIFAPNTNTIVGTVSFKIINADMDLTVHGQPIDLIWSEFLRFTHRFRSLATGCLYKWRFDGIGSMGDMVCLDEEGQLVARFEANRFALKKEGKFELSPAVTGVLMDELVVSGLAMIEYRRSRQDT